ncbi:MAG: ATP synthase F1 subunit delta [Planctomycetota bacterium]|nr:MAG: ATP synthase F1 subunit delta [Planctomycetota bacterium]
MSTPATVPHVYASALIEAAEEAGQRESVVAEAAMLAESVAASPELIATLAGGGRPRAKVREALRTIFAERLSPLLVDFLCLLANRGRLEALPAILRTLVLLEEQRLGIVRVVVSTATPADEIVRRSVESSLKRVLGLGTRIDWQVDEGLVAGLSLRYGDTLIDGSARRRLRDARAAIRSAPLALVELEEGDAA